MTQKELTNHRAYLRMAKEWGKLSKCNRKKVGSLIVKDGMIISDGYNGTPTGFPNDCEDEHGVTKWYVLHAEANAILKVARSTQNISGSTLYLTLSPCRECCKLIIQAGITAVVFTEQYRDLDGLTILRESGISAIQIDEV